jgi:hypothetical protein
MTISAEEMKKREGLIIEEWRQFGYYIDLDEQEKAYRLIGSPFGLKSFVWGIEEYVSNDKNNVISEHDHWTPYGYFEIMTWTEARIDDHAVAGTFNDLMRLAKMVDGHLIEANIGKQIRILEEYSENSKWAIILDIREYGYDPATGDKEYEMRKEANK